MTRQLISAAVLLAAIAGAANADPAISFDESKATGKHVAVQPKDEHHCLYFSLRPKDCQGKKAFARVRCQPSDGAETLQVVIFDVSRQNELWQIYLRGPRHPSKNATYQIEWGTSIWPR